MTQETITQLLSLAARQERSNNALRATGIAIDRLHKAAIWEDVKGESSCHAFIDFDALLKQAGKFALEPWLNQFESMLEKLFGDDVYCAATPVIYDVEDGTRRIDLQVSLDGLTMQDAKRVLQGVYNTLPAGMPTPMCNAKGNVLAFPTRL